MGSAAANFWLVQLWRHESGGLQMLRSMSMLVPQIKAAQLLGWQSLCCVYALARLVREAKKPVRVQHNSVSRTDHKDSFQQCCRAPWDCCASPASASLVRDKHVIHPCLKRDRDLAALLLPHLCLSKTGQRREEPNEDGSLNQHGRHALEWVAPMLLPDSRQGCLVLRESTAVPFLQGQSRLSAPWCSAGKPQTRSARRMQPIGA